MLTGNFPLTYAVGASHLQADSPSHSLAAPIPRRAWILGVVAFAAGGTVTTVLRGIGSGSTNQTDDTGALSGQPAPGSVEWALAMLAGPDEQLIDSAHLLERVSMNHPSDARLLPCFVTLLDLCLTEERTNIDIAGACAIRSLGRLRREDLLQQERVRIEQRRDRPQMRRALQSRLTNKPARDRR